jgi:hypothetical protein
MKKKTCPVGANSNVLKRQIIRPSPSLSSTSQNTTICERAAAILAALPQYQELGQLGPVGSLCIKTKAWRSISETSERVAFRNMLGPPHVIVSVKENAQESKNVNQHQQHCLSNLDSEDSKDSKASVHNVHSASEAAPRARLHEDPPKGHTHTLCYLWLKLLHCYTIVTLQKGLAMQAEIYQLRRHHELSHWALKLPWKTHEEWTNLSGLPDCHHRSSNILKRTIVLAKKHHQNGSKRIKER